MTIPHIGIAYDTFQLWLAAYETLGETEKEGDNDKTNADRDGSQGNVLPD